MRTLGYVVIEVGGNYNNDLELDNGVKLTMNSTIESVSHINREGVVLSAPDFTILKKGDSVIVHHNICRIRYDIKGEPIKSDFHIEGDKYFVPLTEIFMYKRDDEWEAISPHCFVEPIKNEEVLKNGIVLTEADNSHSGLVVKNMQKNIGILRYSNEYLENIGVNVGDTVIFRDDSEYEFKIGDKILYKMSAKDILATVEK